MNIITPSALLDAVEQEKSQRQWELSKFSYWELVDELRKRQMDKEFVDHFKCNVDTTGDVPYCQDHEVEIDG